MLAPQPAPSYVLGWFHFKPEEDTRPILDGSFWFAVKGEVDLQGVMPDCEPRAAYISTKPSNKKELWTILQAPPGKFWHETPGLEQHHRVKGKLGGREICVMYVMLDSNGTNIRDEIRGAEDPFAVLPPVHPEDDAPEIPSRTMSWHEFASKKWTGPMNLDLYIEDLDDENTYTVSLLGRPRVVLTPTLRSILGECRYATINIGLIMPNMQDQLEFVTA